MNKVDNPGKDFSQQKYLADKIFYRIWLNTAAPKAILLIIHGLGEHSGRYSSAADFFCSQGLMVACPDHCGHGLSPGKRGHIESFSDYIKPVIELRDQIAMDYPGVPCFVLGHSMGGLISAIYLTGYQDRFAGAIFSGAALQLVETPSKLLQSIVNILSVIFPTAGLMKINGEDVSRDPKVVAEYLEDPLVHHDAYSARLIRELLGAIEELRKKVQEISLPVLVMHGASDLLTSPEGSQDFVKNISSRDKKLRILTGLYHEILNEPEGEQLMSEITQWINQRI